MNRVALFAFVLLAASAQAAPRDELLRAVPDDYTFCVVVQNLRGDGKNPDTTFQKFLSSSPFLALVRQAPEAQQVQNALETILRELNLTPAQLFDDLLGDSLVFSYRKGPVGQPEGEEGLILLHARDPKLLARLVEKINSEQLKTGELKAIEKIEDKDGDIFRRVKGAQGEPSDFFTVRGNRLVFSNKQTQLTAALKKLATDNKAEPPALSRMKQLGIQDAPLVGLVNPRGFDGDLSELAKNGKGSEQAFLREVGKYWSAVDSAAVFLRYAPAIEIGLSVHVRKSDLPRPAITFFSEASKRSPLWDRVPEEALFAAVGRVHLESFVSLLSTFLTEDDRLKVLTAIGDAARPFLESDNFDLLARGLGPDVGLWLTAPTPESKNWVPDAMLALKVAGTPEGKQAEEAALKGLDFAARFMCLSQKGMRIHTENQGPVSVKYLTHPELFPSGFRPAFASKGGYLLVAGSPQSIAKFESPTSDLTAADEVPVIRVSMAAWRKYLKEHRTEICKFLAKANKLEPAAFDAQLDKLMPILESMERVELVQQSTSDRVTLALRFVEKRK